MDLSDTIDQMARDLSSTPIEESPRSSSSSSSISHSAGSGAVDTRDEKLTPAQKCLRSSIIAIQTDSSISAADKAMKIQALMMAQYRKQQFSTSSTSLATPMKPRGIDKEQQEFTTIQCIDGSELQISLNESCKSFHDAEQEILGCPHYARGAKVQATCCGKWAPCRFCHDAESNHQLDRFKITHMICMYCQTAQPIDQDCKNCDTRLGAYYCSTCHLFENSLDKHIYHCDKCGICRIGKGLGVDYFHCDKCNVCLALHLKDNHRCIERNLDSDCPICGEYMFTSTHTVMFMPCGHSIHWKCYQEHINNSYQCPICWKSLANMTSYFQQIDRMLEEHRMPAEYDNFWSVVLCNDCEKKSKTKYHFLYHKCQECGSYNTKVLNTLQERSLEGGSGGGGGNGNGNHENVEPGVAEMEMVTELNENGSIRPRTSSNLSTSSSFIPDDNESSRNR